MRRLKVEPEGAAGIPSGLPCGGWHSELGNIFEIGKKVAVLVVADAVGIGVYSSQMPVILLSPCSPNGPPSRYLNTS